MALLGSVPVGGDEGGARRGMAALKKDTRSSAPTARRSSAGAYAGDDGIGEGGFERKGREGKGREGKERKGTNLGYTLPAD